MNGVPREYVCSQRSQYALLSRLQRVLNAW
jgi:hypothetical protein